MHVGFKQSVALICQSVCQPLKKLLKITHTGQLTLRYYTFFWLYVVLPTPRGSLASSLKQCTYMMVQSKIQKHVMTETFSTRIVAAWSLYCQGSGSSSQEYWVSFPTNASVSFSANPLVQTIKLSFASCTYLFHDHEAVEVGFLG